MSTILLSQLLEKTIDFDKDERYMATSDLCNELQKVVKIDQSLERKICSCILKQLDDNSNDVQSIAVKCLGILVTKVQESQVGDICDKLCGLILEGKPELRDIYSIGLKTLVADVPSAMGPSISTRLGTRLLGGIAQDKLQDVQLECLDILTDLLKRFGHTLASEHSEIMGAILLQLSNQRPVVRKRATACLGSLGVVLSDILLNRLLENLLLQIQTPKSGQDVRTLIQTIGTLSRNVGHRLGRHLDTIIPLFQKFCGTTSDESMQSEQSNELRENCLQGFESFVLRCPREVTCHVGHIYRIAMDFIQYDPNYSYGVSEEEEMEDVQLDDEFSDEEAGEYSDDDDTSWKVRRAALRVLTAIISCRPEMLSEIYSEGSDILINRFKEREENVRIDVFSCFAELLRAVVISDSRSQSELQQLKSITTLTPAPRLTRQRSCIVVLQEKIPLIVRSANKQLSPKGSVKSKCAVFGLLRQLAEVTRGGLSNYTDILIPSIEKALDDRSSTLKLEALHFLRLLMETHPPNFFHQHIHSIIPHVVQCVAEDWYKIISEALRLIGTIVHVIRPYTEDGLHFKENYFDFRSHVLPLYNAVMPRLSAHDLDQEIKECAISSMGEIISHLGDHLTQELFQVLPLLMDRLQNEITRMSTLKALASIARSPLKLDFSPILANSVYSLSTFLRQQSRSLKHATLDTLNDLVLSNGQAMSKDLFERITEESSILISDSDLHLSHLALRLTKSVLLACPSTTADINIRVLPKALQLSCSPVLQGYALQSLLGFYKEMITIDRSDATFESLLHALLEPASADFPKQAVINLARCVAVLCVNTNREKRDQTIKKFIADIKNTENDSSKHLGLLCLGEIGRQIDLSSHTDLQQVILQSFDSGSEESKAAAAYALGNVTVGNMQNYLPVILSALSTGSTHYLLLSALKEVILCHSTTNGCDFTPFVRLVLPILQKHCENPEEGVRNMVAECLGRLAIIDPSTIVPIITDLCSPSTQLLTRWTAVTSLKYGMTSNKPNEVLGSRMKNFLVALEDEDISVRRTALLTLNSAAHHQPQLIQEHMTSSIVPILLQTMEIKMERVVDLGPFKHKVDDGLVLRKAAYACVDTIIDTLPERMDIPSFLPHLKKGLADQDDVQMLCHQILTKISILQPGAMIGALDFLIDPLDKTINRKVKDKQVGTEVERMNDLIRSALRAVDAISLMPDVGMDRKFQEFLERIQKYDKLSSMLSAIKAERGEGATERQ